MGIKYHSCSADPPSTCWQRDQCVDREFGVFIVAGKSFLDFKVVT
jgi:hypothetical protein